MRVSRVKHPSPGFTDTLDAHEVFSRVNRLEVARGCRSRSNPVQSVKKSGLAEMVQQASEPIRPLGMTGRSLVFKESLVRTEAHLTRALIVHQMDCVDLHKVKDRPAPGQRTPCVS